MSYARNTVSRNTGPRNNAIVKKPFCSTCHKAGKTELEYTSHYPRSEPGPNGIVVCPVILSAECKACGQTGHWANVEHCPLLKERQRCQADRERQQKKQVQSSDIAMQRNKDLLTKQSVSNNTYAALDNQDDTVTVDRGIPGPKPVKDLPKVAPSVAAFSFAAMLQKPVVKAPEKIGFNNFRQMEVMEDRVRIKNTSGIPVDNSDWYNDNESYTEEEYPSEWYGECEDVSYFGNGLRGY